MLHSALKLGKAHFLSPSLRLHPLTFVIMNAISAKDHYNQQQVRMNSLPCHLPCLLLAVSVDFVIILRS